MTSRERLTAASRGGPTDSKAVIVWPGEDGRSDAVVVSPHEVAAAIERYPDKAILGEVLSPFGRAVGFRIPLSNLLREEPDRGQEELDKLVEITRQDIDIAILGGADGVFYRLQGAHPANSTPMEYGGFYLERDRELLNAVEDARLNVLYVEGGPETYLDFVSDLPAHLFAWELEHSPDLAAVRETRQGAIAASHPEADVVLTAEFAAVAGWLEPADDLASA